jgi:hypothetical protein
MKFPEYMKMLTEAKNAYEFSEKVEADLKKIGITAKNDFGKYKDFFGGGKVQKILYVKPTEDEDVVEVSIVDKAGKVFDTTELNISEFSKLKAFLKDVEEFVEAEDKFYKSWHNL